MLEGKFIWLFVILMGGIVSAQDSIQGKIYGDSAIAKYIKISNTIKKTTTFSDENGNFSIKASVGDSILFSSSFYEKKKIILDITHFSEIFVIQLKDKINQLDEVVLKEDLLEKEFYVKTYKKELNVLINNDIKNKPWEYKFPPLQGQGINLKGFKYLKEKLFPKKETDKKYIISWPITYEDLMKLNTNDEFFSDTFFTEDLKISKDFKNIFFAYFEDQKISSKLLSAEKRLLLIEKFFEISDNFLDIINQVKTPPDNKILNDSIKNNIYGKKDFD